MIYEQSKQLMDIRRNEILSNSHYSNHLNSLKNAELIGYLYLKTKSDSLFQFMTSTQLERKLFVLTEIGVIGFN